MIKLLDKMTPDEREVRAGFADTMMDMAAANDKIVYLAADLMGTLGMGKFEKTYPDRCINTGIAEANMAGVACGMSIAGMVPFIHSFGPFATRRCLDQIYMSGAYAKANVKVIGSDPGVCAAFNGGTHMPFEDGGIMASIPEMTVIEPSDRVQLQNLLPKIADDYGMCYIRLVRKKNPLIYADGSDFEIGKAAKVREGKDVAIIASGIMVEQAILAAEQLAGEGITARVLDMFTWKPLDEEAVLAAANETGCIVTAENHNILNGLGSAVSGVLSRKRPTPVEMVGIEDSFGEVGPESYLRERFDLTAAHIVRAARAAINRK